MGYVEKVLQGFNDMDTWDIGTMITIVLGSISVYGVGNVALYGYSLTDSLNSVHSVFSWTGVSIGLGLVIFGFAWGIFTNILSNRNNSGGIYLTEAEQLGSVGGILSIALYYYNFFGFQDLVVSNVATLGTALVVVTAAFGALIAKER